MIMDGFVLPYLTLDYKYFTLQLDTIADIYP
jgi:hypothetical protein